MPRPYVFLAEIPTLYVTYLPSVHFPETPRTRIFPEVPKTELSSRSPSVPRVPRRDLIRTLTGTYELSVSC